MEAVAEYPGERTLRDYEPKKQMIDVIVKSNIKCIPKLLMACVSEMLT